MKKQWYNIYMECIKYSPSITAKVGQIDQIGKIKSEGKDRCVPSKESTGDNDNLR